MSKINDKTLVVSKISVIFATKLQCIMASKLVKNANKPYVQANLITGFSES